MVLLACELCLVGAHFSIENPRDSYVFHMPLMSCLLEAAAATDVVFDQCQYGLKFRDSNDSEFCKKPTRVVGTMPELARMHRLCTAKSPTHQHVRAWGSFKVDGRSQSRTAEAGAYPNSLCSIWAQVVASGLTKPCRPNNRQALSDLVAEVLPLLL